MRSLILFLLLLISGRVVGTTTDSIISGTSKRKAITAPPVEETRGPSYFERYVKPKSIDALINYCAVQWMQEERDSFAAMPEPVAIRHPHYWYDTWINKMWGILVNDSGVTANFHAYGIEHNEDKWRIILTSLHRQLNHQDIDLAAQVKDIRRKRKK